MGFDIKAAMDSIAAVASQNYPFILAALALLVLFGNHRFRQGIEKALTDNWQLTLLAATGIALSLASGYTTFDGIRNFTSAPLLSVFISFGIQGVMLIVAWLIGESFAVGMNQRTADGRRLRLVDASVGMLLGVAFVGLIFYWTLHQYDAVSLTSTGLKADVVRLADVSVYFLLALVLLAMLAFGFRRGGDLSTPYVQSFRLIVKNAVLWVMFFASMGASVFFSFELALQCHLSHGRPQACRRDPHHQPDRRRRRRHRRADAEAPDRGSRAAVRYRGLEGLRQAAGWSCPRRAGRAGRDRELFRPEDGGAPPRHRPAAGAHHHGPGRAGGPGRQEGVAHRGAFPAEGRAAGPCRRVRPPPERARRQGQGDRRQARGGNGRGPRRRGHDEAGQGPGLSSAPGRARHLARPVQDQAGAHQGRAKAPACRESRIAQVERELSTIDGDLAKLRGEAFTAEQRIKTAEAAMPTTKA